MSPWVIACVFSVVAIAAFSWIYSDMTNGVARHEGVWTFQRENSPIGYAVVVLGKVLVLLLSLGIVLHAISWAQTDPGFAMAFAISQELSNRSIPPASQLCRRPSFFNLLS